MIACDICKERMDKDELEDVEFRLRATEVRELCPDCMRRVNAEFKRFDLIARKIAIQWTQATMTAWAAGGGSDDVSLGDGTEDEEELVQRIQRKMAAEVAYARAEAEKPALTRAQRFWRWMLCH